MTQRHSPFLVDLSSDTFLPLFLQIKALLNAYHYFVSEFWAMISNGLIKE